MKFQYSKRKHKKERISVKIRIHEIQKWQKATNKIYSPRRLIFAIPSTEQGLPSSLGIRKSIKDKVVAYHCKGEHCSKPISSFEELLSLITETDKA